MQWRRFLIQVFAALYFGALIGISFLPGIAASHSTWYWPLATFVPVGLLLLLLMGRRRWWAAVGFGMLGAAWLEAAQSIWMPGYAEALDVLWASIGAVLGVIVGFLATAPARRSMRSHESHRVVSQAGNREIP